MADVLRTTVAAQLRTASGIGQLVVLFAALLVAGAALAKGDLREIGWPDLVPKMPDMVDPLAAMDAEQRIELETVLWVRQLSEQERQQRPEIVEEADRYQKKLEDGGINIDKLIADYAAWSVEMEKRQQAVVPELDGQTVRIAGYLLPIEFSQDGMADEFLLVPYVGACIHVPAPPANQIVYVKLSQSFKVEDLYTAVRLTGELKAAASNRQLNLSDGSAGVDVGYQIAVSKLELAEGQQ